MSRAIDKDSAAGLKNGNLLLAYQQISSILTPPSLQECLLEIEFLGKIHLLDESQHVIQDGSAVGISKLALAQAFLVARQYLKEHVDGVKPRTDEEMFAATAVILLFDPEYLTAANSRKRLLRKQLQGCSDVSKQLEKEKWFVDSLLTSRLHRHTKSPVLWSHRRWLISTFREHRLPLEVLQDITSVVFVAGERHPRNYYAWCHARFLMSLDSLDKPEELLKAVQTWCFQHHTDISGWSFLFFLLDVKGLSGNLVNDEALELVDSLRLTNESVWVFLRTLAASGHLVAEQYARFQTIQQSLIDAPSTSPGDKAMLRSAIDWCETYRKSS
ncbi:hypothetical protein QBC35DRAFT_123447 [Podospora australis]|uniref:Uncharacterized protein n=1 Tax=Podospora australis TaxID=1536484 RepID=A0AAN6WXS0_9PEZI|nr:hypothetical protein QBC35DRAFT_123447 [Podospora australis]